MGGGGGGWLRGRTPERHPTPPVLDRTDLCVRCGPVDLQWKNGAWSCPKCGTHWAHLPAGMDRAISAGAVLVTLRAQGISNTARMAESSRKPRKPAYRGISG